jgi:hypothetical protein
MACDKAGVNESPRRTYWPYVEGLSETRTKSQGIFNILKKGGDRFRRGYRYHRGMSSSRGLVNSGKMQLPIKNWHSQLN